MKENYQYPDEATILIFYKFIYKYEILDVKTLTDKQIKDAVEKNSLQNFGIALNTIQKTGRSMSPRDNKEIISLFNEYQKGKQPKGEFFFEKRTKKATSWNSILYHLRNSLAHAEFKDVGEYYRILDYDGTRLSAFGFVSKSVLLQLLKSFVEE